jgi:uncharacterized repeat protein (TIGR03803 family)
MKLRFFAHLRMLYCAVLVLCATTTLVSASVKFKNLVSFDKTNGQNPVETTLGQGIDGNLYGTTQFGGANGEGTVFKISPSGTLTTLSFCAKTNCPDGDQPMAGLTLVIGGDLYGTTYGGGAHNAGTVFRITPTGDLKTIYSFCSLSGCSDGLNPNAGFALIQGTNGSFYGSTSNTFFRLTPGVSSPRSTLTRSLSSSIRPV